ncbi:MAG: hypothetical protein ACKO3B_11490 [Bacteroidota bacterium]
MALAQPSIAQRDAGGEWIVRQILHDTLHHNPYMSQWVPPSTLLYWPEDLDYAHGTDVGYYDQLLRAGTKLVYLLVGTGRVYEVNETNSRLEYRRMDETIYSGYNFAALNFEYRDTIWSYGGYGFWRGNGHLRYFSSGMKGWEIMPVNIPVQHFNTNNNNYFDRVNGKLYVVEETLLDDGIRKSKIILTPRRDTIRLMTLDMNSKNWSVAGIIQEEFVPMVTGAVVATYLPWGKLIFIGPKAGFKALCLDFSNNKVLIVKDQSLGTRLYDSFFPARSSGMPPTRTLNYYHNDTLHFYNNKKEHFKVRLTKDDFIDTGKKLFLPEDQPLLNAAFLSWLALGLGLLSLATGVVLTMRSSRLVKELQSTGDLNQQERELVMALLQAGPGFLSTDSVDALLVPEGKSQDAIKKKRSSVIRSINDKYSEKTGDQEPLIASMRMENDRRMMRYGIAAEKILKARRLL